MIRLLGINKYPVVWGLFLIWIGSIGVAVKLVNLLNEPAGYDPSFDMTLAAFFLLVGLGGIFILIRNYLWRAGKLEGSIKRIVNSSLIAISILLVLAVVTGVFLVSANSAFLRGYQPVVLDEPRPDYSMPVFPTPANPQPTSTYNPSDLHLAGNILSSMDGYRIGEIALDLSPDAPVVESIELYIFRVTCTTQQGSQVETFAVNEAKPFIWGPIQIQAQSFYVDQGVAIIHGYVNSSSSGAYGTLYLRYTDPTTSQSCDLGTSSWTATLLH